MHPVLMIIHSVPHHLWYLEKMENTLCQPLGYTGLLRKQAFKKPPGKLGGFFEFFSEDRVLSFIVLVPELYFNKVGLN